MQNTLNKYLTAIQRKHQVNIVRDYRTLILQLAYFSLADFNILYFFGIVLRISCTLSYLLLHLSFPFYHCHYSTADYFRL